MISTIRFLFFALISGCAAICVIAGAWLYYYSITPLRSFDTIVQFELPQGSSLQSVARRLVTTNILDEPWGFIALGRIYGKAGQIKAGSYALKGELTPLALLKKITGNDYAQESIVFIEGYTFKQIRKKLDENKSIAHSTHGLSDAEVLRQIDRVYENPEGLFYPDTYFFTAGTSDIKLLGRAYNLMQVHLKESWAKRSPNVPFSSPYEALIAASIVEKETGLKSERAMIAAVVVNRLRLGMKLQADPTVIYGMGDQFDGNLRKPDLTTDHPYNTYTRAGLPPTPIAMPSSAAIEATLNPAKTAALYYVSKGDGSSYFSATLAEHNRAVAKYQKSGRH